MSRTIYDTTLLELLPENLRGNPYIIAASRAVDKEFSLLVQSIKNVLTYADMGNASEQVIDMLAAELNVDFYDKTLPLSDRREAVKEAILIHQMNGTKKALLRVFELLQIRAVIKEWFEYGGEPYTFKIEILEVSSKGLSEETNALLDRLIEWHKNARSHMTELNIYLTNRTKTPYYAIGMLQGEEITVYPWEITNIETIGKQYFGLGYQSAETIVIYPLQN